MEGAAQGGLDPWRCPRIVTLQGCLMILEVFPTSVVLEFQKNKGFLPPGTAPARTGMGMLEQDFIPHFSGQLRLRVCLCTSGSIIGASQTGR